MKSSIRSFVLAAFAAATILASAHSASAQIYSHNTASDYTLQSGANVTVNAVIVGQSGNFTIGGQQAISNDSSTAAYVWCWMSPAAGSSTPLPYGLTSSGTIPAGGMLTLSFYGWYSVSGSTELYLVCRTTNGSGDILSAVGNITAAKN
jgi:hypothetical protein